MRHLTGAADRQSAHRIRNQKLRSRTGDACIRIVQRPTSAFNEATPRPIAQLDTLGPYRAGLHAHVPHRTDRFVLLPGKACGHERAA